MAVTGDARFLVSKMDELGALTQWEHRESSVMCLSETWLQEHILDSSCTIRWCNPRHITVKQVVPRYPVE